jgi:hypothetical protein
MKELRGNICTQGQKPIPMERSGCPKTKSKSSTIEKIDRTYFLTWGMKLWNMQLDPQNPHTDDEQGALQKIKTDLLHPVF